MYFIRFISRFDYQVLRKSLAFLIPHHIFRFYSLNFAQSLENWISVFLFLKHNVTDSHLHESILSKIFDWPWNQGGGLMHRQRSVRSVQRDPSSTRKGDQGDPLQGPLHYIRTM